MFKHIFYILLVLGYVNASIFDGLEDAKHAAKSNFTNGINSSPKLNSALDLPHDKVFNSVDNLIKKELGNKFGDAIDLIVEQLKDVGYETMGTVNQIKQLVNEIYDNLKSLSTETRDILSKESESQEQNIDKVQEFFQFLSVEIVGQNKLEFENVYGFQNIVKSIKDKAYNVTQQIKDKLDKLDERFGQLTNNLILISHSSEKQIQQVLAKFKHEFIDYLDVNAITKIVNELNDANHPLVEVIKETVNNRKTIVDKILEVNNYYNTPEDPKMLPYVKAACDLLDMILKVDRTACDNNCHNCCEKIKQYTKEKVPVNYQNKFEMALESDGLNGLKHVVQPICGTHSPLMAMVFFELTGKLFDVLNEPDFQLQERIFLFIEWLKFVIQRGFDFSDKKLANLQNSAQKIMIDLKEHNEKEIMEALLLFKPFQKEFQGIFDDVENKLREAIKHSQQY